MPAERMFPWVCLRWELKESNIRPREIPAPKDSVFLADMRSRQESSKALQEPGTNFLEGVENDLRSTENSQNKNNNFRSRNLMERRNQKLEDWSHNSRNLQKQVSNKVDKVE